MFPKNTLIQNEKKIYHSPIFCHIQCRLSTALSASHPWSNTPLSAPLSRGELVVSASHPLVSYIKTKNQRLEKKYDIYKKILYTFVFSLLFISCALNRFSDNRLIDSLVLIDSLSIQMNIDKICYSSFNKTFFLLNKQENSIYIYRNDLHNIIGKSGFSNENFRRLSDICIGVDTYLYALDSFDKVIKKFDYDGKFIGQSSINNINSPEKFTMTHNGGFFVYDGHSKEIINIDPFDYTSKFSFGRFQIDTVDAMFIIGDYLNIYNSNNNETIRFLLNGMYYGYNMEFSFYDNFGNLLSFKSNNIRDERTSRFLLDNKHFSKEDNLENTNLATHNDYTGTIDVENNLLIFNFPYRQPPAMNRMNQIKVFRILYEQR